MITTGHEIYNVIALQLVKTARNNSLMISLYGSHMEIMVHHTEILKLHSYQRRIVTQFHPNENQLAVMKLKPMAHPIVAQCLNDFHRCEIFRIDHVISTDVAEEFPVDRIFEFVVVDSGHCLFGTKALGYGTGHDVAGLERSHCDKQIATLYPGLFQRCE